MHRSSQHAIKHVPTEHAISTNNLFCVFNQSLFIKRDLHSFFQTRQVASVDACKVAAPVQRGVDHQNVFLIFKSLNVSDKRLSCIMSHNKCSIFEYITKRLIPCCKTPEETYDFFQRTSRTVKRFSGSAFTEPGTDRPVQQNRPVSPRVLKSAQIAVIIQ